MTNLKIVFGLIVLLLLGFQLSVSGFNQFENENLQIEPKTRQGDTVRMTWRVMEGASLEDRKVSFTFNGEKDSLYRVDWGDGRSNTYVGEGGGNIVWEILRCTHTYDEGEAIYNILLYGIPSNEE